MILGVTCVKHLKECTDKEWANLFAAETIITLRVQQIDGRSVVAAANKNSTDSCIIWVYKHMNLSGHNIGHIREFWWS